MKNLLTALRILIAIPLLLALLLLAFLTPIAMSVSKFADADYLTKTITEVDLFDDIVKELVEEFKFEDMLIEGSKTELNMGSVFEEIDVEEYMASYTDTIVTDLYAWMDEDTNNFESEIDLEPLLDDIFVNASDQLNELQKDVDLPICTQSKTNEYTDSNNLELPENCKLNYTQVDYKEFITNTFEKDSLKDPFKYTITLDELGITEENAQSIRDTYKSIKKIGSLLVIALIVTWVVTSIMIPGLQKGITVSNTFVIIGAVIILVFTFVVSVPNVLEFVQDESVSSGELMIATNMAEIVVEFAKGVRTTAMVIMGLPLILNILLKFSKSIKKKEDKEAEILTENQRASNKI